MAADKKDLENFPARVFAVCPDERFSGGDQTTTGTKAYRDAKEVRWGTKGVRVLVR